jgi:phosphonate transport system substrate-binding protein
VHKLLASGRRRCCSTASSPTERRGASSRPSLVWDKAEGKVASSSSRALRVAIRKHGYQLIAVAKGFETYAASFLVRADSPLKSLAELKGKRLGAPDEDSITSWMVRATLRDAIGDPKAVAMTYTRYQDAVPFFVEHTLTHAGATASNAVVKEWQAKGGKVLTKSKAVPIKHLIAAPSIGAEQLAALRQYFTELDASEEGRKKLEPSKLKGFMPYEQAAMLALGSWLGL